MPTSPSLLLPILLLLLLHPTEREMEWLCRRGCVCHEESVQPVQSHLPLLAGQWRERPRRAGGLSTDNEEIIVLLFVFFLHEVLLILLAGGDFCEVGVAK